MGCTKTIHFNELFTLNGILCLHSKWDAFYMSLPKNLLHLVGPNSKQQKKSKQTNKCLAKLLFHVRVKMIDDIRLHIFLRETCVLGIRMQTVRTHTQ